MWVDVWEADYDFITDSQGHEVILRLEISFGVNIMYNFTSFCTVDLSRQKEKMSLREALNVPEKQKIVHWRPEDW